MRTRPIVFVLFGLSTLACGNESPTPSTKSEPTSATAPTDNDAASKSDERKSVPDTEPTNDPPADTAGNAGNDWESPSDASAGAVDPDVAAIDPDEPLPEEVPHAEVAHPGPCKVTWSTGAKLTFAYQGEGGTVDVDADGNGTRDACGTFTMKDGKTTKVEIDEGCNGSVENTIEPTYDPKTNIATASFRDGDNSRDVTLVEVAGFTGLTPGYPIYAARKNAKVYARQGLARKATIKKPWDGPAMTVTFGYDKSGRLERIKEDHGSDGSTDRRLDYRYDDQGNVIAMAVTLGSGDTVQKGRAKLDYTCHEAK